MKNLTLAFVLILLLSINLNSCGDEKSHNKTSPNVSPNVGVETSQAPDKKDSEAEAREKIIDILSSYYTDIASEQLDADKYFAPQLDQFFSSKFIPREKVANSIHNSFELVEDRHISFDPRTLRIEQTPDGYVSEFRGQTIHTRSNDGEKVNASFNNQVIFNKEFQITAYADKKDKDKQTTRSLEPKKALVSAVQQSKNMAEQVLKEFKTGSFTKAQSYIHPKYGFYLVGQPGAYSVPYHLTSFNDIFKKAPWLKKGTDMFSDLKSESIPGFTCEGDDYFDKSGCFIEESKNYTGLTDLMLALRQAEFEDFGPSVVKTASNIEKLIKIEVVETKSGIAFFYGKESGEWYLLIIDMASYSCSA